MTELSMNELRQKAKEFGVKAPVGISKINLQRLVDEKTNESVVEMAVAETPKAARQEKEAVRRRRGGLPLGKNEAKLARPEYRRQGYHRHWINDKPGRLDAAYNNDYDYVTDADGKQVKQRVGTTNEGKDLYAYLMEKPEDWHQEDQQKKWAAIEEQEKQMVEGMVHGARGSSGVQEYIPEEGIKIGSHQRVGQKDL